MTSSLPQMHGRCSHPAGVAGARMLRYSALRAEGDGFRYAQPILRASFNPSYGLPPKAAAPAVRRRGSYGAGTDSCAAKYHHSITSSARSKIDVGTAMPSALAVVKLTAVMYLTGV